MSHEPRDSQIPGNAQLHHIDGAAQSERMQARMAELDLIHTTESKRLGALVASAKRMSYTASRIIGK